MSNLITQRTKAGLTQTELALRAKIHPTALNRIERGVRPNKATADKIAKALEVEPADIFDDYATLRAY